MATLTSKQVYELLGFTTATLSLILAGPRFLFFLPAAPKVQIRIFEKAKQTEETLQVSLIKGQSECKAEFRGHGRGP